MAAFIFQGDDYLEAGKEITSLARQCRGAMSVGDAAFIWRSDGGRPGTGGIVAEGRITSPPAEMEDDAPELWVGESGTGVDWPVRIRLREVRLTRESRMLSREEQKYDDVLGNMLILRFAQQTNYRLEPREADRVRWLWETNRKRV